MTIDEFKKILNMLISKDAESRRLACGFIEAEFPQYLSYELFLKNICGRYVIVDLLYEDMYYMFPYTSYLREKICPYIIYSPYKHCFV